MLWPPHCETRQQSASNPPEALPLQVELGRLPAPPVQARYNGGSDRTTAMLTASRPLRDEVPFRRFGKVQCQPASELCDDGPVV
jgi:hypothetical protein